MKNLSGILTLCALLFCAYVSIFTIPKQRKQRKVQMEQLDSLSSDIKDMYETFEGMVSGVNTTGFNVGDTLFFNGSIDSTAWIPIDTVYGDTILTIDNSNYYKWYKVEYLGIGGPMVIHGTWINHKDSTITEFIITE